MNQSHVLDDRGFIRMDASSVCKAGEKEDARDRSKMRQTVLSWSAVCIFFLTSFKE
jgi:hypothetical protein